MKDKFEWMRVRSGRVLALEGMLGTPSLLPNIQCIFINTFKYCWFICFYFFY